MTLEPKELEDALRELVARVLEWSEELVTWDPEPSQNFDDLARLSFVSDLTEEGTSNRITSAGFADVFAIHRAQIGIYLETTSGSVAHHIARGLAVDFQNRGTFEEFRERGIVIVGEPSQVIDLSYEDPEDTAIVSAASFELPIRYTSKRSNGRKRFIPVQRISISESGGEPQEITRP